MKIKSGTSGQSMNTIMSDIIIIRGGGDIATGVAHRLFRCGYQVVILETNQPTVIRRLVSFAQSIWEANCTVEGVMAEKAENLQDVQHILRSKKIPVLIDPKGLFIHELKPKAVIDAIIAKKNLGTSIDMAPIVIGLGPGFEAGKDAHAIIETNRGHQLGKVIFDGFAEKNTNTPGSIDGFTNERLLRSPKAGLVKLDKDIGDIVKKGEAVATIGNQKVKANIPGVIRGLIADESMVKKDFKIGDIDPRGNTEYCHSISDKARAIAGGVLEALMFLTQKSKNP
jgi:xanthine dehydrogenase accessory factor